MSADADGPRLRLPQKEEDANVDSLRTLLTERAVEWRPASGESEDAMLRRFLHARDNNIAKAADFLSADAAWRQELKVDERRNETAESMLGGTDVVLELQAVLPHQCRGSDRQGRPIIYKHFGGQCEVNTPPRVPTFTTPLANYLLGRWLRQ